MRHMWVEFGEVEFAGDQENHSTDRAEPTVAAALCAWRDWNSPFSASRKPLGLKMVCAQAMMPSKWLRI